MSKSDFTSYVHCQQQIMDQNHGNRTNPVLMRMRSFVHEKILSKLRSGESFENATPLLKLKQEEKFLSLFNEVYSSNKLIQDDSFEDSSPKYRLQVSSSSSDSQTSISPAQRNHNPDLDEQIQNQFKVGPGRKGYLDKQDPSNNEQVNAIKNLKLLMPQKEIKSETQNLIKVEENPTNQQFLYLRQLRQNAHEPAIIDEKFDNQSIIKIHLKTTDLFAFTRLQHESFELQRRQVDYNEQQKRHFDMKSVKILTMGERIVEKARQLDVEKIVKAKQFLHQQKIRGILLAKNFVVKRRISSSNMKIEKRTSSSQQLKSKT